MKYFVMDRSHAKRYSFEPHTDKSIIISITDVGKNLVKFQRSSANGIVAIQHLIFDDVEQGEMNCISDAEAMSIVDFVYDWKDKCNSIIVHCETGKSRSAGVCAAIMKYIENDDRSIFNNSKYTPNMTCYRKVLNAFIINEINKTPCYKCDHYLNGYCLNSMGKYTECCGWKNKNFELKQRN